MSRTKNCEWTREYFKVFLRLHLRRNETIEMKKKGLRVSFYYTGQNITITPLFCFHVVLDLQACKLCLYTRSRFKTLYKEETAIASFILFQHLKNRKEIHYYFYIFFSWCQKSNQNVKGLQHSEINNLEVKLQPGGSRIVLARYGMQE